MPDGFDNIIICWAHVICKMYAAVLKQYAVQDLVNDRNLRIPLNSNKRIPFFNRFFFIDFLTVAS